jgi:UPF0755 protein
VSRGPARRPPVRGAQGGAQTRRRLMTAYGALLTLGAALLLVLVVGLFVYLGPGPRAQQGGSTTVVLPSGAGVAEIASDLRRGGVIGSNTAFVLAAEVTGAAHKLKAGEYAFPSHASLHSVITAIAEGRVVRHFITIPEGVTSQVVMETLMRADFLTGVVAAPAEGAVLPETYEVRRGDDRSAVLRRMIEARDKELAELWAHRSPGLPYRSPEDAVILASIVEKETAKPDERPRIAAIFINRLKAGIRLESDPTTVYGLTGGRVLGHGLRVSELQSQTPYNTYVIPGLPPTPIANPGRASLAAALDPLTTNELYFVADGTGGHVFSSTLAEHQQNVAKWRAIEAKRNCEAQPPSGKPATC